MSRNLLAEETSPYLLQHKDNPVHWRPWGTTALDEAKRLDRPLLLSVGYAACHWCHVMAHESFENDAIAGLMNELFINVKVDREERPDIDTIYQAALQMMGEHGGWPLTMFLTPNGEPFWGGTYFPPTSRWGKPAFTEVLHRVSQAYHGQKETIAKNVAALREGLGKLGSPQPGNGMTAATLDEGATMALRLVDPIRGGTAGAPKFPQPVFFRVLWRAWRRTRAPMFREAVTLTLNELCRGGIYDHLGGGFARYSTDGQWLVPHFEKMLYDNALLIDLLSEVWLETRSPLYAARVRESIAWALAEMRVGDGADDGAFGFASALDAEFRGRRGQVLRLDRRRDRCAAGRRRRRLQTRLRCAPPRQLGGAQHPQSQWPSECRSGHRRSVVLTAARTVLAEARARRDSARARRQGAGRLERTDDLGPGCCRQHFRRAAMAGRGARSFPLRLYPHARRRPAASRLAGRRCPPSRHSRRLCQHVPRRAGALSATGDERYLTQARTWVATANRHHWDAAQAGWFLSADDTTDVLVRAKPINDNAVPSGNGTMVEVLARLWLLTGEDAYRDQAEAAAHLFSGDNPQYLLSIPGLLTAAELLQRAIQVVVVGDERDPCGCSAARALCGMPHRRRLLVAFAPCAQRQAAAIAPRRGKIHGRWQTRRLCVRRPNLLAAAARC